MNQWRFGWLIGVDTMDEKKKVIPLSFKEDRVDIEYVDFILGKTKLGGTDCPKNEDPKYNCNNCEKYNC